MVNKILNKIRTICRWGRSKAISKCSPKLISRKHREIASSRCSSQRRGVLSSLRSQRQIVQRACFMLSLLFLSSCSTGGRDLDELEDAKGVAKYLIASGDTLKVEVWKEPNLSGEVFVREDGSFTMNLIDDVKAEGLTPKQLSESITNRLKKFIPAAAVTVSLVQASAIRYYLSGQFNKPGEYRSDKKINLLQALATGGGFAPFADETEITLIRKGTGGEEFRYVLNYNKIIEGRQPNPQLKTGDFISVK